MKDKIEKELIKLDKKRMNIRKKYKEKLANKKRKVSNKDYIFFPKSIISENNYQLRYGLSWLQNGFILKKGNNVIAVDPGVNFVLRLTESGFDLSSITHIFISHFHLDHSADANVLMDFMIRAKTKATVKIIAPKSVYEEKVISDFHSGIKTRFPVNHSAVIIDENSEIELLDGYKMKFVSLHHSVECYGFKIYNNNEKYTYLSDTSYTKELQTKNKERIAMTDIKDYIEDVISCSCYDYIKNFLKDSDVLIANIDSFIYTKKSKVHLPILDLLEIIKDNNIRKIILAHINPIGELKYEDWGMKLAKYVYKMSKIQTFAIKESGNKFFI